jgi:hypothetical protein
MLERRRGGIVRLEAMWMISAVIMTVMTVITIIGMAM